MIPEGAHTAACQRTAEALGYHEYREVMGGCNCPCHDIARPVTLADLKAMEARLVELITNDRTPQPLR